MKRHGRSNNHHPPAPTPREMLARRLETLLAGASDDVIARALAQNDVGILTTLATNEVLGRELTALDRARLRGVQYRKELLERAGGTLSVDEVAKLLGITPGSIRKAIRTNGLIAMRSATGYRVPAVQFYDGQELQGLRRVLKAIDVESAWMRLHWLLSPEPQLGGQRPLDMLVQGHVDEVKQAAMCYGEQGSA